LRTLARQVEAQLELRLRSDELQKAVTRREQAERVLEERVEQNKLYEATLMKLIHRSHHDLNEELRIISEADADSLHVDRVGVWLFNADRSALVCQNLYERNVGHSKCPDIDAQTYPKYFQALRQNRAIVADNACTNLHTCELAATYLEPHGIVSMLDVAIWRHGEMVGVVCHEHIGAKREWTVEDQDFAASIADMVSLSLETAERRQAEVELSRAHTALQRANAQLEKRVEERTAELAQVNMALQGEISERQQTVEALRRSEERFRSLAENASDIISILDIDGVLRYESPSVEYLLGYKPEELVGHHSLEFIHPDDAPTVASVVGEALQNPSSARTAEFRFRHKDGSWRILEAVGRTVLDDSAREGLVINSRDITERKRAEETLRASEAFKTAILEAALDGIITMDHEGRIIEFNARAQEMFGYTRDEVLGRDLGETIVPPSLRDGHNIGLRHYLATGEGPVLRRRIEVPAMRSDGSEFPIELAVAPIAVGDYPIFTGYIRDISERRQTEEALKQAKETAEEANRAKSEFLSRMSHELRTPMNAVIGMCSLLLDTNITPEQSEYARTIRDSGDSLLAIINNVLDYSKIEANRVDLEQKPFDLRECIESSLDLVTVRAAEKNLNLVYLMGHHVPSAVLGDVTRLRQILVNLLSNAVKFTEHGEVVLSVEQRPLNEGRLELQFAVRDTGIGIPPERMDRLFQSFSQVDASTTRRFGGTGLGLVISKSLCEMMGGSMWAHSDGENGSTFHFTVVARPAVSSAHHDFDVEQPQLDGKRLLIVDENATNRQTIVQQTRGWGMTAWETANVAEAMHLLRNGQTFEIAIVDAQMPGTEKRSLAQEIAELATAQALPVVGLCSVGQRIAQEQNDCFAAFLTKPIKQSQLYNVLIDLFTGRDATERLAQETATESGYDGTLGSRFPLRILLAEDLSVNQKLVQKMLSKMGYGTDIANDGAEVLAALEHQSYDVVLMDIQMPVMDGLEAAQQIARRWSEDVRPRIVALTANAMREDREACIAAGMDDYVAKPVRVAELQNVLARCGQWALERKLQQQRKEKTVGANQENGAAAANIEYSAQGNLTTETNGRTAVVLDPQTLQELQAMRDDGAPEIIDELLSAFKADCVPLLESLSQAANAGDASALRAAAHGLKGAAANMGGRAMAHLCGEVEQQARCGVISDSATLGKIESAFEQLCFALQAETRSLTALQTSAGREK
jgi:PAS domain S-box-containing protein